MSKSNNHKRDQNLHNKDAAKIHPQYSKEEIPVNNNHENAHSRNGTELNKIHHEAAGEDKKNSKQK